MYFQTHLITIRLYYHSINPVCLNPGVSGVAVELLAGNARVVIQKFQKEIVSLNYNNILVPAPRISVYVRSL